MLDMLLSFIGALFSCKVTEQVVKIPGGMLQGKFAKLGNLKGKSYSEIQRECGKESAISHMPDGKKLIQWQATGYHIALIFDENYICEGITDEISV